MRGGRYTINTGDSSVFTVLQGLQVEFTLKEFVRGKEGDYIDEMLDGNDHSIDAVGYAMLDDVLRE